MHKRYKIISNKITIDSLTFHRPYLLAQCLHKMWARASFLSQYNFYGFSAQTNTKLRNSFGVFHFQKHRMDFDVA
jgi:hypothetical protein